MSAQGWVGPEPVRDALEAIYRRAEFLQAEGKTALEILVEWLGDLIGTPPEVSAPWARYVLYGLLAALGLVLLVRILVGVTRLLETVESGPPEPGALRETRPDPGAYRRAAREAADREEYRAAVRALYLYAVARLDERGLVRFHESKTGGDYVRECRRTPGAAEAFARFLAEVERIVFGGRSCGPAVFHELDRMVEAVSHGAS